MGEYYVYEHWRPDRNECFYVGKGKGGRKDNFTRNKRHKIIVNKLQRVGLVPEVRVVAEGLTHEEAFALERKQIAFYGRLDLGTGLLTNLSDGGEGSHGRKLSEETRAKIGAKSRERMRNPENRAAVAEQNRTRIHSPETRRKLTDASYRRWLGA